MNVFVKVMRTFQEVHHKFPCFTELQGTVVDAHFRPKRSMEQSPVQSPPAAVSCHNRVKRPPDADVDAQSPFRDKQMKKATHKSIATRPVGGRSE